jgi:tRNA-dihydrouridine synthase
MVGRGAIGNPWVFGAHLPSMRERAAVIKEHIDLMIEDFGPYGLILMRKHLVRYVHGIRNASRFRDAFVHRHSYEEIIALVDSLAELPEAHEDDGAAPGIPHMEMEDME